MCTGVGAGTRQAVLSNALQQAQRAQQQAEASRAKQEAPEAAFLAVRPSGERGLDLHPPIYTDTLPARNHTPHTPVAQAASSK